jgi:hypothetical protein
MGDRYYIFEVVDLWMSDSESSPSTRTLAEPNYLFTCPGWRGTVPAGPYPARAALFEAISTRSFAFSLELALTLPIMACPRR